MYHWAVLLKMVQTGSCHLSFNGASGWLMGCRLSYFNESDLDLTSDGRGHLDEEGRLVGVVFDDVVVHVDENPSLAFFVDFPNGVFLHAVLF